MFLADKFLERPRPHPRGERRGGVHAGKSASWTDSSGGEIDIFLAEKIVHERSLRRRQGHFQLPKVPQSKRSKYCNDCRETREHNYLKESQAFEESPRTHCVDAVSARYNSSALRDVKVDGGSKM